MKLLRLLLTGLDFSELDRHIDRIRKIRDSYREANKTSYGRNLPSL